MGQSGYRMSPAQHFLPPPFLCSFAMLHFLLPLTLDILSHSCLSSSLCLLLQTALSSHTPTTVLCHSTNRIPLTALSTFLFVPLQFFSLKCSQTGFHTRIHHNTLLKIFNGCLPTTRVKSNSAWSDPSCSPVPCCSSHTGQPAVSQTLSPFLRPVHTSLCFVNAGTLTYHPAQSPGPILPGSFSYLCRWRGGRIRF